MFTNKQLIRNFIFGVFCILILAISLVLTYYITFYDEKTEQHSFQKEDEQCEKPDTIPITNFLFKIVCAFFAGGLVSDKLFLKIGII